MAIDTLKIGDKDVKVAECSPEVQKLVQLFETCQKEYNELADQSSIRLAALEFYNSRILMQIQKEEAEKNAPAPTAKQ